MTMGYLALLIAEIPRWIPYIVKSVKSTLPHLGSFQPKTTTELVNHFDENLKGTRNALAKVTDQELDKTLFSKPGSGAA